MPPLQSPGYYDIPDKLHGTHICVPYKPAGNITSSRNMATTKFTTPCNHPGNATCRVNPAKGFPLWGKLSPQVTDEGQTAGYFPLIRRAGAPPSPQGGRLLHSQLYTNALLFLCKQHKNRGAFLYARDRISRKMTDLRKSIANLAYIFYNTYRKIKVIPHNSKCRYGRRGAADAKPKAQAILCVLASILATQMLCRSRRSGA